MIVEECQSDGLDEVILDGVPVKDAFKRCGFGDYAGFYRAFVKEFGVSPQQYKKKNM